MVATAEDNKLILIPDWSILLDYERAKREIPRLFPASGRMPTKLPAWFQRAYQIPGSVRGVRLLHRLHVTMLATDQLPERFLWAQGLLGWVGDVFCSTSGSGAEDARQLAEIPTLCRIRQRMVEVERLILLAGPGEYGERLAVAGSSAGFEVIRVGVRGGAPSLEDVVDFTGPLWPAW